MGCEISLVCHNMVNWPQLNFIPVPHQTYLEQEHMFEATGQELEMLLKSMSYKIVAFSLMNLY